MDILKQAQDAIARWLQQKPQQKAEPIQNAANAFKRKIAAPVQNFLDTNPVSKTPILSMLPGGQLASQALQFQGVQQPTVGSFIPRIYDKEKDQLFPTSYLRTMSNQIQAQSDYGKTKDKASLDKYISTLTSNAPALGFMAGVVTPVSAPTVQAKAAVDSYVNKIKSTPTKLKTPAYGTSEKGKYYFKIVEGEGISGPNATKTVKTYGPYKSAKEANNVRNNLAPMEANQRATVPQERAFSDNMYDAQGNLKSQPSTPKIVESSITLPTNKKGLELKQKSVNDAETFFDVHSNGKKIGELETLKGYYGPDDVTIQYIGIDPKNQKQGFAPQALKKIAEQNPNAKTISAEPTSQASLKSLIKAYGEPIEMSDDIANLTRDEAFKKLPSSPQFNGDELDSSKKIFVRFNKPSTPQGGVPVTKTTVKNVVEKR